jgi:hypothetical protein
MGNGFVIGSGIVVVMTGQRYIRAPSGDGGGLFHLMAWALSL